MRGIPSGLGHEPVVQMWPHRWNASLFSGRTAAATAPPPVSARTAPPMRPRKERRVKPVARRVESPLAAPSTSFSGRGMLHPLGSEGDELLQLLERVHGSLRRDSAPDEVHGERRAGDVPPLEGVRLLVLVDDPHGDPLARERADARRELTAEAAAGAEESDELLSAADEARERGSGLCELGPFLRQLERNAWPQAQGEDPDLPIE